MLALPAGPVELVLGHDTPAVRVIDAETRAPIAGAQLDIGDYGPFLTHPEPARSGPDGTIPARELVHACHALIEAPGYVSEERELPWPWTAPPDGSFTFNVPVGSYRIAAGRDTEIEMEGARTVESGTHDLTVELD